MAIGAMVDAAIILIENIHKKLEAWDGEGGTERRRSLLIEAMQEVGPTIFFSLLVITVSFLPVFTLQGVEAHWFHKAIPDNIREDYAEGHRCRYANCNKRAVVLYRRVMEALAYDKLDDKAKDKNGKTKTLYDLIDTLQAEGFTTVSLKNSAHELRLFGNYGAHIQDDGLDEVTKDEAEGVAEIAWQFLNTIYVAPYKAEELRQKRIEKGQPPA